MPEVLFEELKKIEGKRILIADDSTDTREFLKRALEVFGCEVEVATDGASAIDLATKDKFDAVILDFRMPVMDGHAASRELRSSGFSGPIVGITAEPELIETIDDDTLFDAFLFKPVNRVQLASVVGAQLAKC